MWVDCSLSRLWREGRVVVVFLVQVMVLLNRHNHGVEAAAGLPVTSLPGFDGPIPFQLETGYIGVGQNEEIQLFYYFVKSNSNPQEDPLILWITGGKTCSALRSIFQQIGPLLIEPVEYNGSLPRLLPFPYSWTKVASFIYLDLPAGTGFSYATTSKSLQNDDISTASNAYAFLQKGAPRYIHASFTRVARKFETLAGLFIMWLIDHPEFLSNPFYVGGHSYAGITVPIITEMISDGIDHGIEPLIQLQGYILGSPKAFPTQNNYRVPYAHGTGLISDQLYESINANCKGEDYFNISPTNLYCQRDLQTFFQLTESINLDHILEPICLSNSTMSSLIMLPGQKSLYDDLYPKLKIDPFLLSGLQCRDDWSHLSAYWANDYNVQMALHVRKGTKEKWQLCNNGLPYTMTVDNTIPYHAKLSKKGYRSLIYSGDHEMVCAYLSTEAWIKSLNYSVIDDWRSWMIEGQVAGYTITYANRMTFATVKGGGHTTPDYRPFESQIMFKRWISSENL